MFLGLDRHLRPIARLFARFPTLTMAAAPPPFKPFTLALIQLGHVGDDKTANLKHAREMILKAAAGAESGSRPNLIVLPEVFNSPYGVSHFPKHAETIGFTPGQSFDASKSDSESVKMLSSTAKEIGTWLLGGSIPERTADGKLYNSCTVYSPKGTSYDRILHSQLTSFQENLSLCIAKSTCLTSISPDRLPSSEVLTGGSTMNFFDTEFARIGLGICYDVRFPELAAVAARQGCHMCIYPGAFNLTTGPLHWELLQRARAVDNQIFFSMCSPARNMTADYHAWGHTMVVDPMARVIAETQHDEDILFAHIGKSL
ncbi:hypothetical protein NM688_g1135 [Phlebia brevispora]|uniref:Uncharacterized protein n=1 Tax=Phlebia brevispora TaxID=194682 RepID=A0ACC1TC15_9APHY|nr:hypothetical protein NM688_g1135 [Phlebia brevispora]